MTSSSAKVALLSYLRFSRQFSYVATEVSVPGNSLADVLASDGKKLIEYEIKTSMADLRVDKDKPKHLIYDPTPIKWDGNIGIKKDLKVDIRQDPNSNWRPEFFYIYKGENRYTHNGFKTVEDVKNHLEEMVGSKSNAPNMLYYVIPLSLYTDNEEKILKEVSENYGIITFTSYRYGSLEVKRKAKKLHNNPVSKESLTTLAKRMSSELATIHLLNYNNFITRLDLIEDIERRINLKEDEP